MRGYESEMIRRAAEREKMYEALARIAALTELLRYARDQFRAEANSWERLRPRTDHQLWQAEKFNILADKITTTLAAVPMTGETK